MPSHKTKSARRAADDPSLAYRRPEKAPTKPMTGRAKTAPPRQLTTETEGDLAWLGSSAAPCAVPHRTRTPTPNNQTAARSERRAVPCAVPLTGTENPSPNTIKQPPEASDDPDNSNSRPKPSDENINRHPVLPTLRDNQSPPSACSAPQTASASVAPSRSTACAPPRSRAPAAACPDGSDGSLECPARCRRRS